jgi:N-acetylglucosaminyl-diphospho-decaprenol L-rhamnosyltransferase
VSGGPSLSVLVVTYDSGEAVLETLRAAGGQLRPGDELVVVDNASRDGTAERIASALPEARVIRAERNLGFAEGANRAAARARGELLLLLNPDAVPQPGTLEAMRAGSARWDVWQGLVVLPDGTVNTAGGELHPLGFAWAGRYGEAAAPIAAAGPREVAFASGACLAVARALWQQLGGFSPDFFMYCEDVDLSLRARLCGGRVGVQPDAVFVHHYEFDKGAEKWRRLERNRWLCLLRTYPAPLLVPLLPVLVALEPALLAYAAAGGWLGSKLRAQAEVLRALPRVRRERRAIQAAAVIGAADFLAPLSVGLGSPYFGRAGRSRTVAAALRVLRAALERAVELSAWRR